MEVECLDWYRSLDSNKRQAIKNLHTLSTWWNATGVLFALLWILTGVAVMHMPSLWFRLPGYVFMGSLVHGMANLMHEATHGNLFRERWKDRWFGFVMAAPALFSVTAYRVVHTAHHRHTRTDQDPDEITNIADNKTLLSVLFYGWFVLGMFLYMFQIPLVALRLGSRRARGAIVLEYLILAAIYTAVFIGASRSGGLDIVLHCWLIPLLVAAFYGNLRGWAEHTMTVPGHPLTQTRTVVSNRLFSFLNINLNYHLEHHLFPAIPWYNLPKLHRLLAEDYRVAGSSIYQSYIRFLIDAFRVGVHGVTPANNGTARSSEPPS